MTRGVYAIYWRLSRIWSKFFRDPLCYPLRVIIITVTPTSAAATGATLIDPAEISERLGLTESESQTAQRLASRASAALVRALGFDPYYRAWQQEWRREATCDRYSTDLELEPRPFVALTQLQDAAATVYVAGTDFTIMSSRRASGEVRLHNPDGWQVYDVAGVVADWTATFTAGWWTPGISGAAPTGVQVLPEELHEAAWLIAKAMQHRDAANEAYESISRADAKVVFRRADPAARSSLPAGVDELIAPYKAIVF